MAPEGEPIGQRVDNARRIWLQKALPELLALRRTNELVLPETDVQLAATNAYQAASILENAMQDPLYTGSDEAPREEKTFQLVEDSVKVFMKGLIGEAQQFEKAGFSINDAGIHIYAVSLPEPRYEGFEEVGDIVVVSIDDPSAQNAPIVFARFGGDVTYQGDTYQYGMDMPDDMAAWVEAQAIASSETAQLPLFELEALSVYASVMLEGVPEARTFVDDLELEASIMREEVYGLEEEQVGSQRDTQEEDTSADEKVAVGTVGTVLEQAITGARQAGQEVSRALIYGPLTESSEAFQHILHEVQRKKGTANQKKTAVSILRALALDENVSIEVRTKKRGSAVEVQGAQVINVAVSSTDGITQDQQSGTNVRRFSINGGLIRIFGDGKMTIVGEKGEQYENMDMLVQGLALAANIPLGEFRKLMRDIFRARSGQEIFRQTTEIQATSSIEAQRDISLVLEGRYVDRQFNPVTRELRRTPENRKTTELYTRLFDGRLSIDDLRRNLLPALRSEMIQHGSLARKHAREQADRITSQVAVASRRRDQAPVVNAQLDTRYLAITYPFIQAKIPEGTSIQLNDPTHGFLSLSDQMLIDYMQSDPQDKTRIAEIFSERRLLEVVFEDAILGTLKSMTISELAILKRTIPHIANEELERVLSLMYGKSKSTSHDAFADYATELLLRRDPESSSSSTPEDN